ncbi:MAG TPA: helix-turn-helix transcriptional regulator, partial [Candidatus Ozemobacteraceae bacterium]|nr:helix-turn-helix transcriptional regulator [Candidatus Ozemobacteraceae bacterium]
MATEKKTVKKAPAKKAPAKKAAVKPAAKKATAKKAPAKKTVKAAKPAKATKKIVKAKPAAKAKAAKKVTPKAKKTVAKKPAKKAAAKKKPAIGKAKKSALKAKKLVAKAKKPAALPKRLPKPWPIARIRNLMDAWGMSQVDFAIFSGVSYDSVTSWCRGRRHLVSRVTSEHLEKAEKIATSRKFKATDGKPWAGFKNYMKNECPVKVDTDLELKSFDGTFKLEVVETAPGKF